MNIAQEITAGLRGIEGEYGVEVLYAAESGSRAWGFPSPDSDYDIRFFYRHPLEWYLRLDEPRETREWFSGELDYSGWDLRKALRLFAGCNPSMNEQLGSPIIYEANGDFHERIRELIPAYFKPIKAVFHYLGIAANFTPPLVNNEPLGVKKLFYIIRPLMAAWWTVRYRQMPPTEFAKLFEDAEIPDRLRKTVDELMAMKASAAEHEKIIVPRTLAEWIHESCERLPKEAEQFPPKKKPGWEPLQELFNEIVRKPI